MRRLAPFVVILVLIFGGSQAAEVPPPENRITLNLPAGTIKSALEALFKGCGKTYALPAEFGDRWVGPITIKDVRFEVALRTVCSIAGLNWIVSGTDYTILAGVNTPVPAKESEKSVEIDKMPGERIATIGMSRYEVRQVLGEPDKMVLGIVAGAEIWDYPLERIAFENARVAWITESPNRNLTFREHAPLPPPAWVIELTASINREFPDVHVLPEDILSILLSSAKERAYWDPIEREIERQTACRAVIVDRFSKWSGFDRGELPRWYSLGF